MKKPCSILLAALLGGVPLWHPVFAHSELSEAPETSANPHFVSVSIEVHGLQESADNLNRATQELAAKISGLNPDPQQMSAEQLRELASVIEQANQLVASFDNTAEKAAATLESLQEPTRTLVADSVSTAYQHSVDPALHSFDWMVTRWIIYTVIGLLLSIALIGAYVWFATRQIREVVGILKSITDDYEIVPKSQHREEASEAESK